MDFFPSLNLIFLQAVKIQFKLGKNPVHQTWNFKLENFKNEMQIDRRIGERTHIALIYHAFTVHYMRVFMYVTHKGSFTSTTYLQWCLNRGTLFGNQAKCSKRAKNSTSWIWLKIIWGVHKHLLYHVQCTKTVFTAWFGCRSSESTTKFTRSGWIYLMKLAYCSKSLLTSQIRQNFNSSVS